MFSEALLKLKMSFWRALNSNLLQEILLSGSLNGPNRVYFVHGSFHPFLRSPYQFQGDYHNGH